LPCSSWFHSEIRRRLQSVTARPNGQINYQMALVRIGAPGPGESDQSSAVRQPAAARIPHPTADASPLTGLGGPTETAPTARPALNPVLERPASIATAVVALPGRCFLDRTATNVLIR
jgi:hypothetical protein